MVEEGKPAFGPEVRAEVDALVEQLNGSHSDVLVLLARYLADRGGAIDAEATAIDPGGIDLSVRTGRAVDHARLEFPGPVADLRELQGGLMGLVAGARARAGDAEPLTGLERELAETATLPTHVGTVVGSRPLTANLVEVSVGGLDEFEPLGFDEFVYVMMARPPDVIADGFTIADYQAQPPDGPVAGAYYTVRRWDPATSTLDLWVVLHGHGDGVAARLTEATAGTRLALWGPRRGFRPLPTASTVVILADETGLAAAAALIEQLGERMTILGVLETIDRHHQPELPSHPGLILRWLHRGHDPPGTGERLRAAVRQLDRLGASTSVFGAAESREMTAIRQHLRRRLGLRADQVHLTGYWRRTD